MKKGTKNCVNPKKKAIAAKNKTPTTPPPTRISIKNIDEFILER